MYATTDHRSREDAAFEPQVDGWMYRSEAFAEDVDHLLGVAIAVAAGPAAGGRRDRNSALSSSPARKRWRLQFAGALFGRAQAAR